VTVRVLLLCGSLQAASSNRAALDVVRTYLEAAGDVVVEDADDLAAVPPFSPEDRDDPAPAVARLRAQLGRADVVVIATPEYAGGLAGSVKNALDWIVGSGELYTKPVVVLSAGTTGGPYARRDLVQTLTWQGAHVVAELGIASPRTKADERGRFTDGPTLAALGQLAQHALDAPALPAGERLVRVRALVARFGIEPGHVAPVP
jgi:NAD(P)H-dependent FMN reductase